MIRQLSFPFIIIVGVIALSIFGGIIFTVDQTKQAIVLRFGELQNIHTTPGLKLKWPFIEEVIMYEKRVLDYDLPPIPITTVDQKRLVVDTYTRYVIKEPVLFFQSVKPATEDGARMRLETMISSTVRNVLGKHPLRNMLSEERSKLMRIIEEELKKLASGLGIEIIDVRIIRTELPAENRNAVFARMNAELNRIATENRAKGSEIAQGIKAKADAEQTIILANANKDAEAIRGQAEAQGIEITAKILGQDPEFYNFYRTMQLYNDAMNDETLLILTTDNDLFRFFSYPEKHMVK